MEISDEEIEPIHAQYIPEIAYRQCRCGCICDLDDDECECTLIDCNCPKKTITEMINEISGINEDLIGMNDFMLNRGEH